LEILKAPLYEYTKELAGSDFIFGGKKPLSETMIKKKWKRYYQEADIDIHQHQL